jgi:hypothetical protein
VNDEVNDVLKYRSEIVTFYNSNVIDASVGLKVRDLVLDQMTDVASP